MIEVYPDDSGEWRWREKADNGEPVADSGEGYKNRGDCIAAARRQAGATDVELVEEGVVTGTATKQPNQKIVLLAADGTMKGVLYQAPAAPGGTPQLIDITPVEVNDGAQEVGS